MRAMRLLGMLGVLAAVHAVPVDAGDIRAAGRCVALDDAAARLACYDAAYSRGAAAPPAPVGFGDNGQLTAEVRAKEKLPRKIDARVVAVTSLSGGLYRLTLDNDQVWVTRDADFGVSFAATDLVTVTRMALGGYQISLSGRGRSVGVKRVQ